MYAVVFRNNGNPEMRHRRNASYGVGSGSLFVPRAQNRMPNDTTAKNEYQQTRRAGSNSVRTHVVGRYTSAAATPAVADAI